MSFNVSVGVMPTGTVLNLAAGAGTAAYANASVLAQNVAVTKGSTESPGSAKWEGDGGSLQTGNSSSWLFVSNTGTKYVKAYLSASGATLVQGAFCRIAVPTATYTMPTGNVPQGWQLAILAGTPQLVEISFVANTASTDVVWVLWENISGFTSQIGLSATQQVSGSIPGIQAVVFGTSVPPNCVSHDTLIVTIDQGPQRASRLRGVVTVKGKNEAGDDVVFDVTMVRNPRALPMTMAHELNADVRVSWSHVTCVRPEEGAPGLKPSTEWRCERCKHLASMEGCDVCQPVQIEGFLVARACDFDVKEVIVHDAPWYHFVPVDPKNNTCVVQLGGGDGSVFSEVFRTPLDDVLATGEFVRA